MPENSQDNLRIGSCRLLVTFFAELINAFGRQRAKAWEKKPQKTWKKTIRFGGGLFHFFKNNFIPYFSGRFPIWRAYFSKGLVQPPTSISWLNQLEMGLVVGLRSWEFVDLTFCLFWGKTRCFANKKMGSFQQMVPFLAALVVSARWKPGKVFGKGRMGEVVNVEVPIYFSFDSFHSIILHLQPKKLRWLTMEHQAFEDVPPIKHDDFPLPC